MAHTVLLAEDEPSVEKMVARRLVANGYEVVVAHDGVETLQKALSCHPDVIVMDIMMPKISGDVAAAYLREMPSTSHIPVIFLSCLLRSGEEQASGKEDAGGNYYMLPKPLDGSKLIALIQRITGDEK